MPIMTIDVPELRQIIESGIAGFSIGVAEGEKKPRVQRAMERTIRLLYEEEELQLAAAVLMIYCARAEGGQVLHGLLELLMQDRADRSARRRRD